MKKKFLPIVLSLFLLGCSTDNSEVLEESVDTSYFDTIKTAYDKTMDFESIHVIEQIDYYSNDVIYDNSTTEILLVASPLMVYESVGIFDYGRIYIEEENIEGEISQNVFIPGGYTKFGENGVLDTSYLAYTSVADVILENSNIGNIELVEGSYVMHFADSYFETNKEEMISLITSAIDLETDPEVIEGYNAQLVMYQSVFDEEYKATIDIDECVVKNIDIWHSFNMVIDDVKQKSSVNYQINLLKYNDDETIKTDILGMYEKTQ